MIFKSWPFAFLLSGTLFLLSPLTGAQSSKKPGAPAAPPKDPVLAQVGEAQILLSEFNLLYSRIAQSAVNPPSKAQFLEDLIRMEAGAQEARKNGQDKDPRIQQAIKQAIYSGFLELNLGQKIQNIPKATNKDLEEFYKRNPEVRFSFVLIDVKPGANANEKALARK
ncbi:MAG: hypothetical protein WCH11_04980, partial [Bdellovibrio sp.]